MHRSGLMKHKVRVKPASHADYQGEKNKASHSVVEASKAGKLLFNRSWVFYNQHKDTKLKTINTYTIAKQ